MLNLHKILPAMAVVALLATATAAGAQESCHTIQQDTQTWMESASSYTENYETWRNAQEELSEEPPPADLESWAYGYDDLARMGEELIDASVSCGHNVSLRIEMVRSLRRIAQRLYRELGQ